MIDLRLTFDDGPSEFTSPILDLLNKHHAKATFFVVGTALAGHWNLLRRMVAHGHTVGNHTLTHARLTDISADAVRVELEATSYLIEQACGVRPSVYRAPYFAQDDRVAGIAEECGLTHVGADCDPGDWRLTSAGLIVGLVNGAQPGAVVCLHDGIPPGGGNGTASRQATVDAVRMILEAT